MLKASPSLGGDMTQSVAPGAVTRLKRALMSQHRICYQTKTTAVSEGSTFRAKAIVLRAKVTKDCLDLLGQLGSSSPRMFSYILMVNAHLQ